VYLAAQAHKRLSKDLGGRGVPLLGGGLNLLDELRLLSLKLHDFAVQVCVDIHSPEQKKIVLAFRCSPVLPIDPIFPRTIEIYLTSLLSAWRACQDASASRRLRQHHA
jgi:hypothetical protein